MKLKRGQLFRNARAVEQVNARQVLLGSSGEIGGNRQHKRHCLMESWSSKLLIGWMSGSSNMPAIPGEPYGHDA